MKRLGVAIAALIFLWTGCITQAQDNNPGIPVAADKKQVETVVEKFPNYVFHLFALAGIGYTNEYATIYTGSVEAADLEYLRQHRNLLQWLNGNVSDLTVAFLFLPCYINLESPESLKEYFSLLDNALETKNYDRFISRYNEYFTRWNNDWMPVNPSQYLGQIAKHKDAVHSLGQIYIRNYPRFNVTVWPKIQPELLAQSEEINAALHSNDYITAWEALTGCKFKAPSYQFILCCALKNGPNFNSLGYERNTCNPGDDFNYTIQMISHETGTHILFDVFKTTVWQNRYDIGLVYKAYECLAKFYNSKIIPEKLVYDMAYYEDDRFIPIYEALYRENPKISPDGLLENGLEKYLQQ